MNKKRPSVKKIAKTNPLVDAAKAAEALSLLKALHEHGVEMERYGLAMPHDRKPFSKRRRNLTRTRYRKAP